MGSWNGENSRKYNALALPIDIIGNRELEGLRPSSSLVGCSWTAPKGHPAATSTPPKEDSWGPAAGYPLGEPPPLLFPIKSTVETVAVQAQLAHDLCISDCANLSHLLSRQAA